MKNSRDNLSIGKKAFVAGAAGVAFIATEIAGAATGVLLDYVVTSPVKGFPETIPFNNVPVAYFLNDKLVVAMDNVTVSLKEASIAITDPATQANLPPSWQLLTFAGIVGGCVMVAFCFTPYTMKYAMDIAERMVSGRKVKSNGPKF